VRIRERVWMVHGAIRLHERSRHDVAVEALAAAAQVVGDGRGCFRVFWFGAGVVGYLGRRWSGVDIAHRTVSFGGWTKCAAAAHP
jgi:hypothetical protein